MMRQFNLPQEDMEFLEASTLFWETVMECNIMRVVLRDFPIPVGYNHEKVDLHVRIEAAYPDTQIDMVYFSPHLARSDSKPIRATCHQEDFDGKNWQRWSRHRTSQNPWRPGIDNLSTHLALVNEWLLLELMKQ